jgi:hypothetical protein
MAEKDSSSSRSNGKSSSSCRIFLKVTETETNWESLYANFTASAAKYGKILHHALLEEVEYPWEEKVLEPKAKYTDESTIEKESMYYVPKKEAITKFQAERAKYEDEKGELFASLIASLDLKLEERIRLTSKAQVAQYTINRDPISYMKLLRQYCSQNATRSFVTQKKT